MKKYNLEWIQNEINYYNEMCISVSYFDYLDVLKELQRLQQASRWIPVEEKLPEEGAMVRCYFNKVTFDGFVKNGVWFTHFLEYDAEVRVTHWLLIQPLPTPPEGE